VTDLRDCHDPLSAFQNRFASRVTFEAFLEALDTEGLVTLTLRFDDHARVSSVDSRARHGRTVNGMPKRQPQARKKVAP